MSINRLHDNLIRKFLNYSAASRASWQPSCCLRATCASMGSSRPDALSSVWHALGTKLLRPRQPARRSHELIAALGGLHRQRAPRLPSIETGHHPRTAFVRLCATPKVWLAPSAPFSLLLQSSTPCAKPCKSGVREPEIVYSEMTKP